jgi:hypothetical protein
VADTPDLVSREEAERLLKEATPGPWSYRPQYGDDWGTIRSPKDADGWSPIVAAARNPTADDAAKDEHRRLGTDPYEGNGRLITAAPSLAGTVLAKDDALKAEKEEHERTQRNRDMWKAQCERQAAALTAAHATIADLVKALEWIEKRCPEMLEHQVDTPNRTHTEAAFDAGAYARGALSRARGGE